MNRLPRIAICGIHIESSTFSPQHSSAQDFQIREGADLVARYPFLEPGGALADAAEYVGLFHARALPGGAVLRETYDAFRQAILDGIDANGPYDGVLFDIHGAMSVVGMDDPEGTLASEIRARIGEHALISAPMDLHGNVSELLFDSCDLLTCYRTAPHVDVWETRERALRHMLEAIESGTRPHRALVHVPVLLPGEMTSTRLEPAASLYARIPELEKVAGLTDASIWIGYAWADEPRNKAAIVVTGDDLEVVQREALGLAGAFWAARHDFRFVAPTGDFQDCLQQALASADRPFFLSDSGDNPGAGGADDCTYTLGALLAEPAITEGKIVCVLASICDPATVAKAFEAGLDAESTFTIGGRMDTRPPGPQVVRARVATLAHDTHGGDAVRLVHGGLQIIVTQRRDQYASLSQYLQVGVDPREVDMVVVKMGYLEPELYEVQKGWLLALTPGGVDQDLRRLGHQRVDRPMIGLDAEVDGPPQRARVH